MAIAWWKGTQQLKMKYQKAYLICSYTATYLSTLTFLLLFNLGHQHPAYMKDDKCIYILKKFGYSRNLYFF